MSESPPSQKPPKPKDPSKRPAKKSVKSSSPDSTPEQLAEERSALLNKVSESQAEIMQALTRLVDISPKEDGTAIKIPWCHILGEYDAAIQYDFRVITRDGEVIRQQGVSNLSEMTNPKMLAKSVQNFHGVIHSNVFSPLSAKFADWIQSFILRDKETLMIPAHGKGTVRLGTIEAGGAPENSEHLSDS